MQSDIKKLKQEVISANQPDVRLTSTLMCSVCKNTEFEGPGTNSLHRRLKKSNSLYGSIFKIADNIRELINFNMKKREINFYSGDKFLGKINIKRGIFQGDSLFPSVLCLIPNFHLKTTNKP